MNRRQKIIVSITGIFIVLLALIGLTYAYFLTKITGNPTSASISVTTANLALEYEEGTPVVLSGVKIVPDTILGKKTFVVTNKGDAKVDDYGVYLVEVINTMKYQSDVQIRMTCTKYATSVYNTNKANIKAGNVTGIANLGTCNGYNSSFPSSNSLLTTNSINTGETQVYSLEVEYLETGQPQTEDMGKELSGMLHIANQKDIVDLEGTVTGASTGDYVQINSTQRISKIVDGKYKLAGIEAGTHSLKVMGSNGSPKGTILISIKKGKTPGVSGTNITIDDNSQTATVNITGIASELTVNVSEVSPFTSGTLAYKIYNNGANVLLTNGTTVNKKLNETQPDFTKIADGSNENNIGLFKATDDYGTSYYFRGPVTNNYLNFAGFTWRIVRINGDGSVRIMLNDAIKDGNNNYITTYHNLSSESSGNDIRGHMNDFYTTYIENPNDTTKQLSKHLSDNIFCDDGTVRENSDGSEHHYYYGAYIRLNNSNPIPTLECPEGRYTVNGLPTSKGVQTYKYLEYPIGSLNGDEAAMAGAKYNTNNTSYYLYKNNLKTWLYSSHYEFWNDFTSYKEYMSIDNNGKLTYGDHYSTFNVRPVVNLRAETLATGNGTDLDPYNVN